jgi:hypothetical protein
MMRSRWNFPDPRKFPHGYGSNTTRFFQLTSFRLRHSSSAPQCARPTGQVMSKEATEIEVEVVEIDGAAPIVAQPRMRADTGIDFDDEASRSSQGFRGRDWQQWQGRIRTLDSRWWPLWVLLGIIAVFLLLTLGIVIAAVYLVLRVIRKILRLVTR